jgi:hypothetical protein
VIADIAATSFEAFGESTAVDFAAVTFFPDAEGFFVACKATFAFTLAASATILHRASIAEFQPTIKTQTSC